MSKPGTEYYNLEKVSEVLSVSTAEVNRMREQNKLRAFRDGSNWKFRKEDVHNYLAESIKSRGSNGQKSSDSGFDLAGDNASSSSSFDLLMEDASLPDGDQLVSTVPAQSKSDLDLAALDRDDDLSLAEESSIVPVTLKKTKDPRSEVTQVADDDDSSALIMDSSGSNIMDDDESILSASGSSPQLGLAGDSGFDVLLAGEESEVLLVDDETTDPVFSMAEEDFSLEPAANMAGDDDSDSSSQVIAIDVGLAAAEQDADPFGEDAFGGFDGFETAVQTAPVAAAVTADDPFGAAAAGPAAFDFAPAPVATKKTASQEEEYPTGMLVALVAALVVMALPGMMLLDTMVHMWSWGEPFVLNSILMGTIAGWFGL